MYLTRNGVKTHEFAYSTYGELTKGEYGEVCFMYNGRLGVMTESNGLYYMRARYYNSEIRRFIDQDIITGSIENSQSLNRYAYCQGNPVNYLDPFGLSPQSFGSWAGHTILNLLSFVPVFGNAADAFNAVWYLYEGNYAEAIACAVGAIPFIGNLATGFNIGSKVVKGCNIAANGGKAAIGFYNGVQNVMNIDHMIRTGTGRWYDYLGQGVQFGLNMFVSAIGVNGAWNGISNLVGELNYKEMQKLAEKVSWDDIDGGAELDELLGTGRKFSRTSWTEIEFDLQFFASDSNIQSTPITRSEHAKIRSSQGRIVSTAINDINRATPSKIYIQMDGRYVIQGNHGRVHILEPSGEIVTTMNKVTNFNDRVQKGRYIALTETQKFDFAKIFQQYLSNAWDSYRPK